MEPGEQVRYNNALLEQRLLEMKIETEKLASKAVQACLERQQLLLARARRGE